MRSSRNVMSVCCITQAYQCMFHMATFMIRRKQSAVVSTATRALARPSFSGLRLIRASHGAEAELAVLIDSP